MDWKDILWPWGALKEARKDASYLRMQSSADQQKITAMEADMLPLKTRIAMQKVEINRLNEIIDKQPKRNERGRFQKASKS